jgi:dolichol-phosphate mannosyltransferase
LPSSSQDRDRSTAAFVQLDDHAEPVAGAPASSQAGGRPANALRVDRAERPARTTTARPRRSQPDATPRGGAPRHQRSPRPPHTRLASGRATTLSRFALVGASGLVVNQLLLWVVVDRGHLGYLAGAVVATQGSTTWNFLLTERLVFPNRTPRTLPRRFLSFAAINNATLLLRVPLLAALVAALRVHYLTANLVTLLVVFAARFAASDQFIWKAAAEPGGPTGAPERVDVVTDLGPHPTPVRPAPSARRRGPVHRYDLGGVVTVASEIVLPELAHFATDTLDQRPDLVIRTGAVGDHRPRARPLVVRAPQFVAYQEHLGRIGANFRVDFADQITIVVGPLLARSPHVVYTNVVEALLRFVLVSRDRVLLHSATIELGGRGVMLTARTDTGKTGTILRLLRERGGAFLSDDMTIVDPSGHAFCYPKPLTISSHTLRAVDQGQLTASQQLALAVQSRVHSKRGRTIGARLAALNLPIMALNATTQAIIPPPKYMVDQLVACAYAPQTTVADLFVIQRGPHALAELPAERAVELLLANTDDAYGFPPFCSIAPAITIGGHDYQQLRERERELLEKFMVTVRTRLLVRDDFSWADAIPTLLAADAATEPPASGWPPSPWSRQGEAV